VSGDGLKQTPLFQEHRALGARMVPFAGYRMPVQYAGVVKEHHAVRMTAGVFDVSHMGQLELSGPHAVGLCDWLVTNDVAGLAVGKAMYTVCVDDGGGILDDLIVYRLEAERLLVVCNAANRAKISALFLDVAAGHDCVFVDRSDETALIALQGPKALTVLADVGADQALLELGPFGLAEGRVAGVPAVAARTGYTGEDGVEIFCANDDAAAIWRSLVGAGASPIGLGARDTLRLEARLSLYGNDIDETTNPYEAGLGWVVKLDKGEFRGREALRRVKEDGPARRLVGIEMVGRGIARKGYPIVDEGGQRIGVVTSGSPSPTLGKNIGLGYVPVGRHEPGQRLGVEIRGKVVEAVVVKTPFYKRPKT
jgi:aminomethyltransferase